ncbi:AGC/PKA protein kinase [Paracoccidioides brasiliensis]|nr:AGC/PKA protein kinase [Paracoccidioides brasiliensis]
MRGLGNLLKKKKKRTKDSRISRDLDLSASPVAESTSSSPGDNNNNIINNSSPLFLTTAATATAPATVTAAPTTNTLLQHPAFTSPARDSSCKDPASSPGTNKISSSSNPPASVFLTAIPTSTKPEGVASSPPTGSTTAGAITKIDSTHSAPMNPLHSPGPPSSNIAGDPSHFKQHQQQQQQPQQQSHHSQNVASIKNIINPPLNDEVAASPQPVGDGLHAAQQRMHSQHPQQQHQQQQQQQQQQVQQSVPSVSRQTKGKYSLDDFTLQRTLGTGSFGRVHLVQSRHNQRFYAIKVLKKAQVVKMKQVEHTNDERRMLQRVKHPFLITLWGTFQDVKNLYMVMDFVEGGELFSLLRKSQRFPNPVAKFYAAEVTLALEYLHDHHIIYRDLKPENLLLDRYGHLKITDFGFAKEVKDITWTLCGTPDYLAPEVVSSKGYNMSVDWWSLGILIFEMLCGFTPFWDGGSPMKIYENIIKCRVKYPSYMHPDAQDLLSQLITPDLTVRLGNLHGGSKDVKDHPWFAEVTWDRLARKDIDAPYIPPVKGGQGDASQFDRYPEETEPYGGSGDDPYGDYFVDF